MSKSEQWIVIPNWDKFQHYPDRTPPWIKTYVELLDDEAYRDLPLATRGLLHDLWALYAKSRGILIYDVRKLSSRLGVTVKQAQCERLNDAGFIAFVASKPLALTRSREGLLRKPKDARRSPKRATPRQNRNPPSPDTGTEITYAEYLAALENGDAPASDEAKP